MRLLKGIALGMMWLGWLAAPAAMLAQRSTLDRVTGAEALRVRNLQLRGVASIQPTLHQLAPQFRNLHH